MDEDRRLDGVFAYCVTAQIARAHFGNVEGPSQVGGSQVFESMKSGPPILAAAITENVRKIRSSSPERSNVDPAQESVSLVVPQRAF